EADLHHVHVAAAHVDAALLHHRFHLLARLGRHVLEVLAHVGHPRPRAVHFALAVDLPEAGFDGWRGLGLRGGGAEDGDQRCEDDRAHWCPSPKSHSIRIQARTLDGGDAEWIAAAKTGRGRATQSSSSSGSPTASTWRWPSRRTR